MIDTSHVYCPLGYERVYLPLCEVADAPFHIQEDEFIVVHHVIRHCQPFNLCNVHCKDGMADNAGTTRTPTNSELTSGPNPIHNNKKIG